MENKWISSSAKNASWEPSLSLSFSLLTWWIVLVCGKSEESCTIESKHTDNLAKSVRTSWPIPFSTTGSEFVDFHCWRRMTLASGTASATPSLLRWRLVKLKRCANDQCWSPTTTWSPNRPRIAYFHLKPDHLTCSFTPDSPDFE